MKTIMSVVTGLVIISLLCLLAHGKPLNDEMTFYQEKKLLELFEKLFRNEAKFYKSDNPLAITDVTDPEDTKTIGECQIIVRNEKKSQITSKAAKACWPFSRKETCPEANTRDFSYNPAANQNLKNVVNDLDCGKNMFYQGSREVNSDKRLLEERIVGGHKSNVGRFPWMVALGRSSHGLSCGGALVASQWVLSAAHCFDDEDRACKYNVRVGSFNWGYDTEGYHEDISASKIVRHPQYDEETNDNDIAMIKLSKHLDLGPHNYVNSICLPEQGQEYEAGKSCVAAGWGTLAQDGNVPMTLREVEVPLISFSDCAHENMTTNQFCAGSLEGGIDTCQGDSGGPVMCQRSDGRWYVQGVTSYGNGCGKVNWPGVYTEVPNYTHWIKSVMSRFGQD